MLPLIIVAILTFVIFRYVSEPLKYWKNKKVKYVKPFPFFGNSLPIITRKVSNTEFLQNCYQQFSKERYFGIWQFSNPSLVVKDPELIKDITIKDFEIFPDHPQVVSMKVDPLWSQNLFTIQGLHKWHQLRTVVSPAYTSGKMKAMYGMMQECTENFLSYLNQYEESVHEINIKDVLGRLASDIMATTAFGLTCNTLSDSENEFYKMVMQLSGFTGLKRLPFIINVPSPIFESIFKIPVISKRVGNYFSSLITDAINYRKSNGITRPDILQLLIKAQDGKITPDNSTEVPEAGFAAVTEFNKNEESNTDFKITEKIISAVSIHFLFSGVDTISTFLSYTIYELSLNPEVQKKLYNEIEETVREFNGKISYDTLVQMKYLDMVITESLRKWPPFSVFNRKAAKPYKIPAKHEGESDFILDKNSVVVFPVFAIHRDPQLFPNPESFDPERFSDKNKKKIVPYTYIPFGVGPRNCVSSRFALVEGKLAVFEMVRNFEIVSTEKTKNPIVLDKNNFLPVPQGGIWVGLIKRKHD